MADSEQPTPIEGTRAADVEMGEESAVEPASAPVEGEDGLTEMESEVPGLVLFAE
jgi:hypothetical protein